MMNNDPTAAISYDAEVTIEQSLPQQQQQQQQLSDSGFTLESSVEPLNNHSLPLTADVVMPPIAGAAIESKGTILQFASSGMTSSSSMVPPVTAAISDTDIAPAVITDTASATEVQQDSSPPKKKRGRRKKVKPTELDCEGMFEESVIHLLEGYVLKQMYKEGFEIPMEDRGMTAVATGDPDCPFRIFSLDCLEKVALDPNKQQRTKKIGRGCVNCEKKFHNFWKIRSGVKQLMEDIMTDGSKPYIEKAIDIRRFEIERLPITALRELCYNLLDQRRYGAISNARTSDIINGDIIDQEAQDELVKLLEPYGLVQPMTASAISSSKGTSSGNNEIEVDAAVLGKGATRKASAKRKVNMINENNDTSGMPILQEASQRKASRRYGTGTVAMVPMPAADDGNFTEADHLDHLLDAVMKNSVPSGHGDGNSIVGNHFADDSDSDDSQRRQHIEMMNRHQPHQQQHHMQQQQQQHHQHQQPHQLQHHQQQHHHQQHLQQQQQQQHYHQQHYQQHHSH